MIPEANITLYSLKEDFMGMIIFSVLDHPPCSMFADVTEVTKTLGQTIDEIPPNNSEKARQEPTPSDAFLHATPLEHSGPNGMYGSIIP